MEQKRVNLDGIMYDENGNFIPLAASHGNISSDLANFRDTYMKAEKEYFEYLLAIPRFYEAFNSYLHFDSGTLFSYAEDIHDRIENGNLESTKDLEIMKNMTPEERELFHLQKLEYAEALMCLLLAAARDKARILELVLTMESGKSLGR